MSEIPKQNPHEEDENRLIQESDFPYPLDPEGIYGVPFVEPNDRYPLIEPKQGDKTAEPTTQPSVAPGEWSDDKPSGSTYQFMADLYPLDPEGIYGVPFVDPNDRYPLIEPKQDTDEQPPTTPADEQPPHA